MKYFILTLALIAMAAAVPTTSAPTFLLHFYEHILEESKSKNIIYSPVSITSAVALAYLGAEGETANEIRKALTLSEDKEEAAQEFSKLVTKSADNFKLNIVNRVYVDNKYELAPKFNEFASKYFGAAAEKVNFEESEKTAENINTWVSENTANKINGLFDKSSFDEKTAAVLVNAIYFKGAWYNPFYERLTEKKDFSVSKTKKVPVDMMFVNDKFIYGEIPELDAKFVELPYDNTDIRMKIFLPNTVDGLEALEAKMVTADKSVYVKNARRERVNVHLPKFKIEYEIDLKSVLEKVGLNSLFSDAADFSSLLSKKEPVKFSAAVHKAFIEVDEKGTEAAAATGMRATAMKADTGPVYDFVVDHPFTFVLKDSHNLYFVGRVVNF